MSSPLWRRERGSAPSVADRADPAVTGAATAGRADGGKVCRTPGNSPRKLASEDSPTRTIFSCTWPRASPRSSSSDAKSRTGGGRGSSRRGKDRRRAPRCPFPRRLDERRPSTRNSRSGRCRRRSGSPCRRSDTRLRRRVHDRGGGGRASRAGECAGHDDGGYDQRVGVRRDEGAGPSNVHRCRVSSFCFFARRRIPTRA